MEPMKIAVMVLLVSILTGVLAVLLVLVVQDLTYSYIVEVTDPYLRLVRAAVTLLLAIVIGYVDVKIAQKLFSE
jgi:ABC-type nickel/cobalt efflux system permease component RcnA